MLPSGCSIKQAPESAAAITTFCQSVAYKVANRSRASVRTTVNEFTTSNGIYAAPNPLNSSTMLHYTLSEQASVSLYVTDLLGKRIITLLEEQVQGVGEYNEEFLASNLPAGIYLYTVKINNLSVTKRLVVIK